MTRRAAVVLVIATTCATLAESAVAHERVRALVAYTPSTPVAGVPCLVSVRFESLTGVPQPLRDREVRFVADMTGHAMRPVEAVLRALDRPGEFTGTVSFTMAGPWRVVVSAAGGHDTISGTTGVEVALEAEPTAGLQASTSTPTPAAVAVDMDTPAPGSPVRPWTILLGAALLVVTAETAAIVRKLRAARARGSVSPGGRWTATRHRPEGSQ